jgi:DNA-binding NarL/FixJ family response regulator
MEENEHKLDMTRLDGLSKPRIRIVVADDHPLMRQAIVMWLEKESDFEVVAEASNGQEVVKLARELSPDVVIMDIGMPILNGIEATRQISTECPNIGILVLTIHSDNDTVLSILQAGAKGYLIKTSSGKQVIQAVRTIAGGEAVWSLPISREIIDGSSPQKISAIKINRKLSTRELEILKLISKGMGNKNIALELGLQENSVKSYLTNLFVKLGVGTRTEAVSIGLQNGIININDLKSHHKNSNE